MAERGHTQGMPGARAYSHTATRPGHTQGVPGGSELSFCTKRVQSEVRLMDSLSRKSPSEADVTTSPDSSASLVCRWPVPVPVPFAQVMRTLCTAFECPYIDILHSKARMPRSAKGICGSRVDMLKGRENSDLPYQDPRPIVVGDCPGVLDSWERNETLRSCVTHSLR